jgi:Delta3-Delta2-enoyl-CoA isomerase
MTSASEMVTLTKKGRIAIITLNQPKKLNAMNLDAYYRLSCLMRDVAKWTTSASPC